MFDVVDHLGVVLTMTMAGLVSHLDGLSEVRVQKIYVSWTLRH